MEQLCLRVLSTLLGFHVCLDYWTVVAKLFEAHNQMEPTAAVSMMSAC
jgi:hypothetical protein